MLENAPIYNIDDKIPIGTLILTILQHFFALAVYMTYPVIITTSIGGGVEMTTMLISVTVIGCGIATILQALSRIGSGYLLPIIPNSSYLPASLLAATGGGLPMLYGMYIFAGLFEIVLSRLSKFFRFIFPEEIVGVVLLLLGIAIVPFAFPLFFGSVDNGALNPAATAVGIITLSTMIILSLIPKRIFKFYSILIGIVIGGVSSVLLGVFSLERFGEIANLSVFSVPNFAFFQGYAFDPSLLAPFIIGVICIVMKSTGNFTMIKNYTKKGDRKTISRGLFAEGLGLGITGALGGIGVGTSSSAAGMVVSTGIASKKVGIGLGILLIICGFFPIFGWIFSIIPHPILGAILLYAVAFVMISGIQSISSRYLDSRRTFVVTLPILVGVSSAVCSYLYMDLPSWVEILFSSALTSGSFFAVFLGLVFKLGISRHRYGDLSQKSLSDYMEDAGKAWTLDKNQIHKIVDELEEYDAKEISLTLSRSWDSLTVLLKLDGKEEKKIMYQLL
ncbi:MAG TPA: purine/pyrimidine permease [Methanocorpusculum sp.]|nr:purine/pyrimidine permease [Methanocorpusculum sp.]